MSVQTVTKQKLEAFKVSDRSPTCSTCQNHEPVEAPEGASLKCKIGKMIGVIVANGCIAEITAQNCDAYSPTEIVEAEIIPELSDLESQIESGQRLIGQGEQSIWSAAALIRQHSLWKVDYQSFEDYCLKRWNWQKSNAHEVAGAGAVFLQLKESGVPESELPTAIAAYRPLRKLQPEDRRELLQQVMHETGRLTADAIKQAVEQQTPTSLPRKLKTAKPEPPETPTVGERSPYIFDPIDPKTTVWVLDDGKWTECQAVAQSDRGWVQVLSADGLQSSIPPHNFSWISPTDKQPNSLASELKSLAEQKSDEIYNKLCKLNTDADLSALTEIAEEVRAAIAQILESHLL